jgi:hypothetical protein
MPPPNDNFANATPLTGYPSDYRGTFVTYSVTGQTNAGASPEALEPVWHPYGNATVWYSFTPPGSFSNGFEVWFRTSGATAKMIMDVFIVDGSDTLTSLVPANNPPLDPYADDHSRGIGYTNDAGVALICRYPFKYYIRVTSRQDGFNGNFDLLYGSGQRITLGNCASCPPIWGPCNSETYLGSIAIADVNTQQRTSFGSLGPGTYVMRYCKGAIFAPGNGGWYVTNQFLDGYNDGGGIVDWSSGDTLMIYNSGSWGPPFVAEAQNIPGETAAGYMAPYAGPSLDDPVGFWPPGGDGFQSLGPQNLSAYPTQESAETFARCGAIVRAHYGGDIYLFYIVHGVGPYSGSSITLVNGLPNPVWGLYKANPSFVAAGMTFVSTVVSGGVSATTMTFLVNNIGACNFDHVTVTLSGVAAPSAPQVVNFPNGITGVTFAFTTPPTPPVPVTLSFSNPVGDTFAPLTYNLAEIISVTNAVAAGNSHCGNPATLNAFRFTIQSLGAFPPSSAAQAVITLVSGPAIGVTLSSCTGPVCTGTSKTTVFGAVTSTVVFIETEVPASGSVSVITVDISDGTYSAPTYTYTYTWP